MRTCSCGGTSFKCYLATKAAVIITKNEGAPVHETNTGNIMSHYYYGPYECTECGKTYTSLNEPESIEGSHKKSCACGSTEFIGRQRSYFDVIVDSSNNYLSELSCYESENPYGPYRCIECGFVYEELDELEIDGV